MNRLSRKTLAIAAVVVAFIACFTCGCTEIIRQIGCGPNAEPATYVFAAGSVSAARLDQLPTQPAEGTDAAAVVSTSCVGYQDGPPDSQTLILGCVHGPIESSASPSSQVRFGPFDLRKLSAGDSVPVDVQVDHTRSGGSCWASAAGAGVLTVTQAHGQAASGPAYVTADFSRQAIFTLDFDGTAVAWTPGYHEVTDCARPALGRIHATGTLDQTASDYGERPVCH